MRLRTGRPSQTRRRPLREPPQGDRRQTGGHLQVPAHAHQGHGVPQEAEQPSVARQVHAGAVPESAGSGDLVRRLHAGSGKNENEKGYKVMRYSS